MKTQNRPGLRVIVDGIEYEPKPKPLLADAKVGDLCKRMDGKWVQIETLCSLGGMPWICYEIGGLRYINNGEQLNTKDRNLDIIDYYPLAPEGSSEWALQMWKLGNDIRNETGVVISADYESEEIRVKHLVDVFPSGWQIYKEPEPQYKVGDWVEVECQNKPYHKQVLFVTENRVGFKFSGTTPSVCFDGTPSHIFKFIRKLSPSEVIINIGCLSGTVRPVSTNGIHMWFHLIDVDDKTIATIRIGCLDKETRKLVEGLLKAQEEDKPC